MDQHNHPAHQSGVFTHPPQPGSQKGHNNLSHNQHKVHGVNHTGHEGMFRDRFGFV